ncbi:MAG: GNAT family N-acetyltransferase [Haliangiales bacterium]
MFDRSAPNHGVCGGTIAAMDTPLFETERLLARRWRLDDAEAAFAIYGDPEVVRYIGSQVEASVLTQRATLAAIIAQQDQHGGRLGSWPLIVKPSAAPLPAPGAGDDLIGTILLKPLPDHTGALSPDIEIGWHLARRAWGQGFATEAGRACLRYGFEQLGLEVIHAVVIPSNEASKAVARRLGMTYRGKTDRYYRGAALDYFTIHAPAPG